VHTCRLVRKIQHDRATALRERASAPIASAVASEPGRSEQPEPSNGDRGRFEVEIERILGWDCFDSLSEERVADLCERQRINPGANIHCATRARSLRRLRQVLQIGQGR
jgi:hypothetical protein